MIDLDKLMDEDTSDVNSTVEQEDTSINIDFADVEDSAEEFEQSDGEKSDAIDLFGSVDLPKEEEDTKVQSITQTEINDILDGNVEEPKAKPEPKSEPKPRVQHKPTNKPRVDVEPTVLKPDTEAVAKKQEAEQRMRRMSKKRQEIVSKASSQYVSASIALTDVVNTIFGVFRTRKVKKIAKQGAREIFSDGYGFVPFGKGYMCTCCPKDDRVEIPARVDGKPVIAISPSCWLRPVQKSEAMTATMTRSLGLNIHEVILPDTLEVLYSENFTGLINVRAIVVPESVKECSPTAFVLSKIKEVWYDGNIDDALRLFRSSGVNVFIKFEY